MQQPTQPPAQSQPPGYNVFVGSSPPSGLQKWWGVIKKIAWPAGATLARKSVTIAVIGGTLLTSIALAAVLVSNSRGQNPTTTQGGQQTVPGENDQNSNEGSSENENGQDDEPGDDAEGSSDSTASNGENDSGGGDSSAGSGNDNGGGDSGGGNENGESNNGGGEESCALPAYPKPSCTGVPEGTSLTTMSGNLTLSGGEVLDGVRVTGNITITGNNILIKNSEIYGQINNWAGGPGGPDTTYTIQDSTVGEPSGCNSEVAIGSRNFTAIRVHVRNFGDGFRISGDDVTIKDSFADICSNPGDHSDGIQGNFGGTNNLIEHNTIDQRFVDNATSPIFWSDESKDVRVINNLLMGGGYTIRLYDGGGSNIVATGNRVVEDSWAHGPVNSDCGVINPWSDNRLVTIDGDYNVLAVKDEIACAG